MINTKERFIINFEEQDEEFVENFPWDELKKGYDKAKTFFDFEEDIYPLRINFIYSPEEYLFFSGYKIYENWMCACTGYNNTIHIFAPSAIEKHTIHKKEEILKTLIHEITHFFYGYMSMKKNIPLLLLWDEGIANYVAEKDISIKEELTISSLKSLNGNYSNNYLGGYQLIKRIMNYFKENGNKKILEFLMKADSKDNDEVLFKKFEEVFGKDFKARLK